MKQPIAQFCSGQISILAFVLTFLLMFCITGAVPAADKHVNSNSTDDRFKDEKFDFTIQMPDGWILEEEDLSEAFTI